MTGRGQLVQIQGTAETAGFSKAEFQSLMAAADTGIQEPIEIRRRALDDVSMLRPEER